MKYKIVESVPDKNGIIIIAIKQDSDGQFDSREEALKSLYNPTNRSEYDRAVDDVIEILNEEIGMEHMPVVNRRLKQLRFTRR